MRRHVCGVAALAMLLLAACSGVPDRAGGQAQQTVTVLKVGQPNAGGPFDQLRLWADEVARLSGGALQIQFENAWRDDPTNERMLLRDVRDAKYDMASVSARVLDQDGSHAFQALSAPLLVDSYELEEAVLEHSIADRMLSDVHARDVEGVTVPPGILHRLASTRFAPTSAAVFAGKVIGTPDSHVGEATVRALGGTPAGLYSSANVNGMDALTAQPGSVSGNSYQDRFRHLAGNVVLWPRPLAIMMGKKAASSLGDDQRRLLVSAAQHVWSGAIQAARDDDAEGLRILCGAGVVIDYASEQDLAGLRAAVQPVYDDIGHDPRSKSWLDEINRLKVQIAASTDVVTCPSKPAPAAMAKDGIPQGTYERSFTRAELRRNPLYQDWWPAGRTTLTFKDGVMTQVNPVGDVETLSYTLFRGRIKAESSGPVDFVASYRVTGDKLYLTDFFWPDCTDCGTDEAAYGTGKDKPWVKVP